MKRLAAFTVLAWFALHLSGSGATIGPVARAQEPSPERTQPPTADGKLNIIAFGAHPDDCDQRAGGIAANAARPPGAVRRVTNGDAGHQTEEAARWPPGGAEAREAGRRIGVSISSSTITTAAAARN
jgi:hypothetical protein